MAVLVINSSSDLYGSNRILLETLQMLKPRKVILILPSAGLLTDFIYKNSGYEHIEIKIISTMPVLFRKLNFKRGIQLIRNIFFFRKSIKKIKNNLSIEWAYVNTLSSFVIVDILKQMHLKILLHVHEILENNKLLTNLINRYSVKWADEIITVSKATELNLIEANKKGKIITILNGINDMRLNNIVSNHPKVTITLFGRIKPEKGIWYFLDAVALLDENTLSKASFVIAGSAAPGGNYFIEKLQNDISEHPAKKYIHFKFFIPDIKETLNNSDVIVVPSLMKDPFPTCILEAASAGKPVIATNNGGATQSVKNNVTGFLISPSNTKIFADCLQKLIHSKQMRKEMGEAARKFYVENFTIDIFKRKFISTVEDFEKQFALN